MVMTLLDHWRLTTEDQAALLGLAPGSRAALANYRRGKPIGSHDLLIAAHARSRGMVLITRNLGEFRRVPKLPAEGWPD